MRKRVFRRAKTLQSSQIPPFGLSDFRPLTGFGIFGSVAAIRPAFCRTPLEQTVPTFTAINDEAPYSGFPITSRRACVHEARQRGAKRSAYWQNSKVVQKFRLRRCRACMWLFSDFQSAQPPP